MKNNYTTIRIGNLLNWDTPIMRYTSLYSLKQILNLQFYVRERQLYDFMDGHEKGNYSIRGYAFPFSVIGHLNNTQRKIKERELNLLMENIIKSYETLTSCWTLSDVEKEEMWKDKEVLIKTTLGMFIASLDLNCISSIICDKIKYSPTECIKQSLNDFLFCKEGTDFFFEEELRLYIDSDLRNGNDINGKENNKSALLPLNGYTFIDSIIFNSHLSESQVVLKNDILANYPQIIKLIKESNI